LYENHWYTEAGKVTPLQFGISFLGFQALHVGICKEIIGRIPVAIGINILVTLFHPKPLSGMDVVLKVLTPTL
jgi:hypothetical protein